MCGHFDMTISKNPPKIGYSPVMVMYYTFPIVNIARELKTVFIYMAVTTALSSQKIHLR